VLDDLRHRRFLPPARSTESASEFQLKLLERAGSARAFAEVLNSEAGLLLMRSLATEQAIRPQFREPRERAWRRLVPIRGFSKGWSVPFRDIAA